MFTTLYSIGGLVVTGVVVFILLTIAASFRVVVSTNEVQIVQRATSTTSYGKGQTAGNVYWRWPSWVPIIGLRYITLPMSVFDQRLEGYHAYDKDRVPFQVDIIAFFRITDSNMAAQRIHTYQELLSQLENILQGAIRTILASHTLEEILEGRSQFGIAFTKEVDHQLAEWGVQNVKCIELMDIRDVEKSMVIANIMAKRSSAIEKESRIAVAENRRDATNKEIEAKQAVDIRQQEAAQMVGQRTAERDREVGIANQQAQQAVQEQAAITKQKEMAVLQVGTVREAEITRDAAIVKAEQDRQTMVIRAEAAKRNTVIAAEAQKENTILAAEATKGQTVLVAEGDLTKALKNAEGVQANGAASAEANRLLEMSTVSPQIALAKEIGANSGYQTYLVSIRQVEANENVGIEQAKALGSADIKIIASAGNPPDGIRSVADAFSAKGGLAVAAAIEAVRAASPVVDSAIKAVTTNGQG